jgi:hypothetical protein
MKSSNTSKNTVIFTFQLALSVYLSPLPRIKLSPRDGLPGARLFRDSPLASLPLSLVADFSKSPHGYDWPGLLGALAFFREPPSPRQHEKPPRGARTYLARSPRDLV